MSPKTVVILSPPKRREVIQENILKLGYQELAGLCHCTERTIKRDVRQWKREGGFEEFLLQEFLQFYPTIKTTFPEKAFDRLCYLLGKTITQKAELKEEISETTTEIKVLIIDNSRNPVQDAPEATGNIP